MSAPASCVATSTASPAWRERVQIVAGRRIAYRDCGNGPPVLLLHGIGSGAGSWELLATLLMQRMRVIAWDAPGYGDSDALAEAQPSAKDYAHALRGLTDALGLQRFVLVGHSLGAMMAAAYAAAFPSHVQVLLLADPAQGYAHAQPAVRERARSERVQLLNAIGPEQYAQQRASALLRPQPATEALLAVQASMRRLRSAGFEQACAMLANDDIWRYLRRWSGSTRVVSGDLDTITPPADVSALALRLKVPLRLLPGAGHASYLDAPASFAQAVLDAVRHTHTAKGRP